MKLFQILYFWILLEEARAELHQSGMEAARRLQWLPAFEVRALAVFQNGAGTYRAKSEDTVV